MVIEHPVLVRGAGAASRHHPPILLRRTEEDFVPALLEELGDAGGLEAALRTRALPDPGAPRLTLFQPVHRVFHLVLLEVVCDQLGYPRLDPVSIESAGLVLRRHARDARGNPLPDALERWVRQAPTERSRGAGASRARVRKGWMRFQDRLSDALPGPVRDLARDLDQDPEAARRPGTRTGRRELDRRVAMENGEPAALEEAVTPLFVAPPEVCAAAGRTLLFGLVPVTSTEQADAPEPLPSLEAAKLSAHLPALLKAGPRPVIPNAGRLLRHSEVSRKRLPADVDAFVRQLRQIAVELDAFGNGDAASALRAELEEVRLPFLDRDRWPDTRLEEGVENFHRVLRDNARLGRSRTPDGVVARSAAEFLAEAAAALLSPDDATASVRMPLHWASIDSEQAARLRDAAGAALTERAAAVRPRAGRFDDPRAQYRVRAFVRVKEEGGCSPRLVWSDHSEPFSIAPWFASSGAPPAVVPLPDPTDRAVLRAMKPNVAFAVPEALQSLLQANDPLQMLEGDGQKGPAGLAFDWICSFSIPIITLCAFIVLNIFLALFDLIFRWMLFLKICIPIPKRR